MGRSPLLSQAKDAKRHGDAAASFAVHAPPPSDLPWRRLESHSVAGGDRFAFPGRETDSRRNRVGQDGEFQI